MVRIMEKADQSSMVVENPTMQRISLLQAEIASESLPKALTNAQFSTRPLYLIYSQHEIWSNGSNMPLMARLDQIQEQQAEMLRNMTSAQLTEVMTQATELLQTRNADDISGILRLPAMALMMATWLPRKAKEGRENSPP
jgi:hypothetical protein